VEGSLTHILLHIFCGRLVLACEQAALDPSGSSTLFSDARGTFGIGRLAIEGADGTGAAAAATTPPLSPPLVGLSQPRDDDHHHQPPQRASHAGRHRRRASKRAPARAAPRAATMVAAAAPSSPGPSGGVGGTGHQLFLLSPSLSPSPTSVAAVTSARAVPVPTAHRPCSAATPSSSSPATGGPRNGGGGVRPPHSAPSAAHARAKLEPRDGAEARRAIGAVATPSTASPDDGAIRHSHGPGPLTPPPLALAQSAASPTAFYLAEQRCASISRPPRPPPPPPRASSLLLQASAAASSAAVARGLGGGAGGGAAATVAVGLYGGHLSPHSVLRDGRPGELPLREYGISASAPMRFGHVRCVGRVGNGRKRFFLGRDTNGCTVWISRCV
jgi:hypothetical protein